MGKIKILFNEVKVELSRASWPKKEELWGSTWIVIAVSMLLAIIIGAMDIFFSYMIGKVLR
ncbi:MAG: preprotein translocase subunit SecE [bacterium]|nr:preprotein translocase subunit SecE [bacterium]